MSEISGPQTSVTISEVPVREKMAAISSGNSFSSSDSTLSCIWALVVSAMLGMRVGCSAKAPSLSWGMNSLPTCVAKASVAVTTATAATDTPQRRRIAHSTMGR